jgi:heme/copper-type cytochrome/quinol oxidase subunit 2
VLRNLLRTGGSGLLILTMMLGGSLVLWVGVPLGWLYVGAQVQSKTNSLGAAMGAMFVGVVSSIVAIVAGLGWLNRKHIELREAQGHESHGGTMLEAVMTVSAAIAVIAFAIWFFVIEGPGPSLAPRN